MNNEKNSKLLCIIEYISEKETFVHYLNPVSRLLSRVAVTIIVFFFFLELCVCLRCRSRSSSSDPFSSRHPPALPDDVKVEELERTPGEDPVRTENDLGERADKSTLIGVRSLLPFL